MTLIFFTACLAGLAYCAAPGVVNAEGIRRGLDHGFRASMIFQTGAMVGGMLWAIIAVSGLAMLRPSAEVQQLLAFCGGLIMLLMAWNILRKAWRQHISQEQPKAHTGFVFGLLVILVNPFTILFWLSVGGGLLTVNSSIAPVLAAAIIVGTFMLIHFLWNLLIATVATYGRYLVRPTVMRWINVGTGATMVAFGGGLCWETVAVLMGFLI